MRIQKPLLFCGQGCGAAAIEMLTGIFLAFEEEGIVFDRYMASSGSALFTSLYASGHRTEWFRNLMENKPFEDFACLKPVEAVKSVYNKSNYMYDNSGLFELLQKEMTAEATMKVQVSVTKLKGMKAKMYPAMPSTTHASGSIPILFAPVMICGEPCGDGGIGNNVPLPSVKECADYKHVFVFLAPPDNYEQPTNIVEAGLNLLYAVMNREIQQFEEAGYRQEPNVTVLQLPTLMTGGLLGWSNEFELRNAAYKLAKSQLDSMKDNEGKFPWEVTNA